jgi:1,4-alpha-glucan branching enzyme
MGNMKKNVGAIARRGGVSFRVWAPFAESVAVAGSFNNWGEYPLENEEDGYWATIVPDARPGQEYKYVIKNGDKTLYRNDPRALHFTISAGNSVIAAPGFDWGNEPFKAASPEEQVIYEIHVGTFNRPDPALTGTFKDVCDKLDYLQDLGVTTIELMPINSMLMDRGWGYAIDYIFAIESLYGGRYGFLQFVKAAHARGIGVMVDVVFNHFGPDSSLDLWQFDGWNENGTGGIYFYNDWRAETPWGNTRPDFGRHEVQQYILDSIRMWVHDCRVDGLRVDSTIFIRNAKGYNNDPSTDLPDGWYLLQRINELARKINPAVLTVAEDVADNDFIVKPTKDSGAGFSAQWELGFSHSLREALRSSNPAEINFSELCGQLGRRFNSDPFQRVIYSDSHDSAANGSARTWEVISPGKAGSLFAQKQAVIAGALLMTTPGVPMLFQGQEFMQGGSFNDWEGLDWKLAERHKGIVLAYKHLIALRKNEHHLTAGLTGRDLNLMHIDEVNKVIAFHRWKNGGPGDDTVVVINFGDHMFTDYSLNFPRTGKWQVRFNSSWKGYHRDFKEVAVSEVDVQADVASIALPPSSVLILSQNK